MKFTAEEVAHKLGDAQKLGDGGWKCKCPSHTDNKASLSVREVRGKLLFRCHANCTQSEVIEGLKREGLWSSEERRASWTPIRPVPVSVQAPDEVEHKTHGKPTRRWTYRESDGRLIGFVFRFEDEKGKTTIPMSWCKSDDGREGGKWVFKSFDKPRPLYRLDELAKRKDAKVLVFEGEKTADAGAKIFHDYVCIAWPGGSKAVKFVDTSPLLNRSVTLWPDADKPGIDAMNTLAEILLTDGLPKVWMVRNPEFLNEGWDVADDIPEGLDIHKMLETAEAYSPVGDGLIDQFNRRFAFVLVGGRGSVLRETIDKEENKVVTSYLTPEGFAQYYANNIVKVGRAELPAGRYWLTHEDRRSYEGVTFLPGKETPGMYNLWRGFSVEPDQTGDWSIFREHLLENAACGNQKHFDWIFGWFAHMFQRPWDKSGTSLSFRGNQGTGKTIIGKIFGRLMHNHYTLVDDARYVFGQFNSHMASTLLLHSDEAFWGGDPRHVGKLRSMVTSDTQRIEHKGRDPVEIPNFMRLLITTNSEWVVPAAQEERRFAVFDIGTGKEQNQPYFVEMLRQLRDGGYSGLLYALLSHDLSTANIRVIPNTAALLDQKSTSMSDAAKFWYECLMEQDVLAGEGYGWPDEAFIHKIYDRFLETLQMRGVRYRPTNIDFFKEIRHLSPPNSMQMTRKTIAGKKIWTVTLPDIHKAREYFDDIYKAKFPWLSDDGSFPVEKSRGGDEIPF